MRVYITPNLPPFRWGYRAITLWPVGIFVSSMDDIMDDELINHEMIHWEQQKEMLGIFFYLWYGIEYLKRLIEYGNHWDAYYGISFEQEANCLEMVDGYLDWRHRYNWIKFIRQV